MPSPHSPTIARLSSRFCFFFNDSATTEIYTLSLHDALPIWTAVTPHYWPHYSATAACARTLCSRSEEHTSELQSHVNLVCRLLLEKKKHTLYTGLRLFIRSWNTIPTILPLAPFNVSFPSQPI